MPSLHSFVLVFLAAVATASAFSTPGSIPASMLGNDSEESKKVSSMKRPLGDNIVTQAIYTVEMMRVKAQSETPTEENGNWGGEPKEWAESDSIAQKVSSLSQIGPFAAFKQWIADSIAGDYDVEKITARVDETIEGAPVAMFSFTTCPFCLKAKDLLANELGVKPENIQIVECDEDPEGNAIRAVLGKRTGRTSMPSIWIKGAGYVGVIPLNEKGELRGLLQAAGALD